MLIADVAQWNERHNASDPRYTLDALAERYGVPKTSTDRANRVIKRCIAPISDAVRKAEITLTDAETGHRQSDERQREALQQVRIRKSSTLASALHRIPREPASNSRASYKITNHSWSVTLAEWLKEFAQWRTTPKMGLARCTYVEIHGYRSAKAVRDDKPDFIETVQRT